MADKLVELEIVEDLSCQTVEGILKNILKPHLRKQWSILPQVDAKLWPMESILEVYTRPYDPLRPQVCTDETSKQLLKESRQSLPMEPGSAKQEDYEYEHGGNRTPFYGSPQKTAENHRRQISTINAFETNKLQ